MARIRTVKPTMWTDGKVLRLSDSANLLFIALLNQADDEGRLQNDITQIEANAPRFWKRGQEPLEELIKSGLVIKYGENYEFLEITNFTRHQRIDKPQPSSIPRTFQEHSKNVIAGKEGKGKEGKGTDIESEPPLNGAGVFVQPDSLKASQGQSIVAPGGGAPKPVGYMPNVNLKSISALPKPSAPKPNGDYKIETPLQLVVCGWKVITGNDRADRAWDKLHWKRTAKSAAGLLEYFGNDWHKTIDCCQEVYEELTGKHLSCTIETVVKRSAEWKVKNEASQ